MDIFIPIKYLKATQGITLFPYIFPQLTPISYSSRRACMSNYP